MTTAHVIRETLLMMAFTFAIGFGVAYIIKILEWSMSFFGKGHISGLLDTLRRDREEARRMRVYAEAAERNSELDMLRYLYENRNDPSVGEPVNDLYALSRFYSGQELDSYRKKLGGKDETKDETKDEARDQAGAKALMDYYGGKI